MLFIQSIKDGIFRDYIIKKRFPYTQIRITVKKKKSSNQKSVVIIKTAQWWTS